jgi:ferric-dicitrate binding protein FerR (iron transport regulator)
MTDDIDIHVLLSQFLAGEASPEEAMRLEDWKTASVTNQSYFESCTIIYGLPKLQESKERVWRKLKSAMENPANNRKITFLKWHWIAAASLLLLFIAVFVIFNLSGHSSRTIVYQTKLQPQQILLQDSTRILLAPQSALTISRDFGKNNRSVSLDGSASFDIQHDSKRMFLINMQSLHVKDIGTRFFIRSSGYSDTVYIAVQEGEIIVYDDYGSSANLGGKQQAFYLKSSRKINVIESWKDKNPASHPVNNKKSQRDSVYIPDLSTINSETIWQNFGREIISDSVISIKAKAGEGTIWLKNYSFVNGRIEVDLKGKNLQGQSFVGIAFHIIDNNTYDAIYFRPFNFLSLTKNAHSVQYISMPAYPWQKLRDEFPGKYESKIANPPNPDEWYHASIEINFPKVNVFVNHEKAASLVVDQLSTQKNGSVGIWIGNLSEGKFKNLRIISYKKAN